jgi:tripartite-type tricarboxylate transporter receptor subunit TctC
MGRRALCVNIPFKRAWMIAMGLLVTLGGVAHSATNEFFKGKTVRIVVGLTPGGVFDTYSRSIARHLGKQIPGNPTVIVENMPGAGSLVLANHLYKVAKPDGLTIGNFNASLLMGEMLGRPGIEFDARKFEYLGVPAKLDVLCAFTKSSGITSFDRWKASKVPVKIGGTTPGSALVDAPRILRAAFRLPTQVITGYKGTAEIKLAMDGGELAGICGASDTVNLLWANAIQSGDIAVVLQARQERHPDFPKVPLALEFAKTDEERQFIQVGMQDPALLQVLYSLPPGTPKDRVQVMRKAFADTMRAPEYAADAQKAKLRIDPATSEEIEKSVDRLYKLDRQIVVQLKEILK